MKTFFPALYLGILIKWNCSVNVMSSRLFFVDGKKKKRNHKHTCDIWVLLMQSFDSNSTLDIFFFYFSLFSNIRFSFGASWTIFNVQLRSPQLGLAQQFFFPSLTVLVNSFEFAKPFNHHVRVISQHCSEIYIAPSMTFFFFVFFSMCFFYLFCHPICANFIFNGSFFVLFFHHHREIRSGKAKHIFA